MPPKLTQAGGTPNPDRNAAIAVRSRHPALLGGLIVPHAGLPEEPSI